MFEAILKWVRPSPGRAPESGDEALAKRLVTQLLPPAIPQLKHAGRHAGKLMDSAPRAIGHMRDLVENLGAPLNLNREAFFRDPKVNAMFTSAEQLQGFLRHASLRTFFEDGSHQTARILVTATPVTRKQFGSAIQGEIIQKDVLQRGLTFEAHRCPLVAENEATFKESIISALMDLYASKIGEMLMALEARRAECEHQTKSLGCKIKLLEINLQSMGGMFSNQEDETLKLATAKELRAQFEAELADLKHRLQDPSAYVREVASVLDTPGEMLSGRRITFRLDEYGIIHDVADTSVGNVVEFSEFTLEARIRVALAAEVHRSALED
jgi:hypothetical protein